MTATARHTAAHVVAEVKLDRSVMTRVVGEVIVMRTMNHAIISRRSLLTSGAAFAASLAAPSAFAQDWPQKPVRVLVGFAAGGNIDNLARVTCARLVRGVRPAVRGREPRRRHGHDRGRRRRARAADGHTFFWAGTGTISIFPAIGKAPYYR